MQILVVTPPTYALYMDLPPFYHATHATWVALPLSKYLISVYFRKQVHVIHATYAAFLRDFSEIFI